MRGTSRRTRVSLWEALFCVITIIGVVLIGYSVGRSFGVDVGRQEVGEREHYDRVKAAELRACRQIPQADVANCTINAIEAARDKSETRQDLYAQQDAARWNWWTMMTGWFAFGMTSLGVYFVKRTLDATLKAVEDTSAATDAMLRQNEISERVQRPWLSIDKMQIGTVIRHGQDVFEIDYVMDVKNTGSLPAVIVGAAIGTEKADVSGQIAARAFVNEAYVNIAKKTSAIAPNAVETFFDRAPIDMGIIDYNGLRPNGQVPNLWIGVAYQDGDANNKIHYTLQIVEQLGIPIRNGNTSSVAYLTARATKTLMGTVY